MAFDSKFYLSIFWRRFPYFLLVSTAVSAIGIFISAILPPTYRSQALLLVESEQITVDKPATRTNLTEILQRIRQRILARGTLLDMANKLDIYPPDSELTPDQIVADMRNRTEFKVEQKKGEAPLLTISFSAQTGELSAKVTNEFVTRVLKEHAEIKRGQAAEVLRFFEQEEKRLGQELDRLNKTILEFKRNNRDSLPDSLSFRRARQTSLQESLIRLEQEQAELQDKRKRLVELYKSQGMIGINQENMTSEEKALQLAKAELERALAVFSADNPKVKVLRARVEQLEKIVLGQRGKAGDNEKSDRDEAISNANKTLYDLQLEEIDGRLNFIRKQMNGMREELAKLEETIQETPANALRQAELERDYSLIRAQYDAAVAALAKAKTGEIIESRSKGQRITVIEQPVVPDAPASPPRLLIAIGSVVAGVLLGLLTVVLLEVTNRAVRRPADIIGNLGITPIATLPFVRTHAEAIRRRIVIYAALALALIGIPAGLYVVHTYYMPMDVLLQAIMDKTGLSILMERMRQGGA